MIQENKNNSIFYFAPVNKLGNIAYRKTCLFYGADYVFSEMINLDKLLVDDEGQLKKILFIEEDINKTIFQIISENLDLLDSGLNCFLDKFKQKNVLPYEINFNMGCPHSSLTTNFCGAGILRDLNRLENVSRKLAEFCLKNNIISSIKIRIGLNYNNLDDILLKQILQIAKKVGIKKVYIHARFLKQGYNKPAIPELIYDICKNEEFENLKLIYNGDIIDTKSYLEKKKLSGLNNVLIGRAALENPKIFYNLKNNIEFIVNKNGDTIDNRIDFILKFLEFAKKYNIDLSKTKANLAYLTNKLIGGREIRCSINNCKNLNEIENFFLEINKN